MRKKMFAMLVLVALVLLTRVKAADADETEHDYAVLDAAIQRYVNADPDLCVRALGLHVLDSNRACMPIEKALITIDRNRDRTYARIVVRRHRGYETARLVSVFVRSRAVKQVWLARLKAAKPKADIVPELKQSE